MDDQFLTLAKEQAAAMAAVQAELRQLNDGGSARGATLTEQSATLSRQEAHLGSLVALEQQKQAERLEALRWKRGLVSKTVVAGLGIAATVTTAATGWWFAQVQGQDAAALDTDHAIEASAGALDTESPAD